MQVKKIPVTYDIIPEDTFDLAHDVIKQYHSHLADTKVCFLYMNKDVKDDEKVIYTTQSRISGKVRAICDYDFLIVIHYQPWRDLDDTGKRIVLDHALSHLWVEEKDDGELKYKILKHDFEEFSHILERYRGSKFFERLIS